MITLVKNGSVFGPEPLGQKDILVAGRTIAAVEEPGKIRIDGTPCAVIEAAGRSVLPGFIDSHVHILGGGGEGGPATRAPEIRVEEIVACGVTTVIGCLGTDGITRHMESLLAKARALEAEGITTFIFSGSYEIPPRTITGSVRSDLVLIDKVVGAGEIALSDHRSSQPTFEEIARLAAECRVGGMLGGKAGVLHLHLGDGPRRLAMLFRLSRETEIPPTQVIPTHVNRNPELFEEAIRWAAAGGYLDLTTGPDPDPGSTEVSAEKAIALCLKRQVPLTRLTISSDSNGSLPVFGPDGKLVRLTIATQRDLIRTFRVLLQQKIVGIEDAARLFSTNAATFYKLSGKGEIRPGRDGDLIIFDDHLELMDVLALGRRMMAAGKVTARSTFSPVDKD
ncbi:MAG TPA: beta-aspartyl-peptidase [Candidatus Desulfaltia sp.]|nr:beta-aspartyl-peptidase [Candidatus Desulfaltia sp.]